MRGMVLLDMMVAMGLCTVMVLLLGMFISDAWRFSQSMKASQELRRETFALMQNTFPTLIREAVAIDYEQSSDHELVLYMDKWTQQGQQVRFRWDQGEGQSRLLLQRGDDQRYLTSSVVQIQDLRFQYPENPRSVADFDEARTFQPMVGVFLSAQYGEAQAAPRLSYASAYTLRNASFSTLPLVP